MALTEHETNDEDDQRSSFDFKGSLNIKEFKLPSYRQFNGKYLKSFDLGLMAISFLIPIFWFWLDLSCLFSINFCYCISQRWLRFCYLIFSHSDVSPFFTPLKTNCKLRMYSKKCNRSTHRPKRDSLRYFKSKVLKMKYLLCPTKFKIPKKKISNDSLKRTNFTKFSSRMEVDMFLRNSNP